VSLFEDNRYQYRDTFFVFFDKENRPDADKIQACLAELGPKYDVTNVRHTDGNFESVTVVIPHDCSAMDIAYEDGEEVVLQIEDVMQEFQTLTLVGDDSKKLVRIQDCTARLDVFHFEQVSMSGDDEILDPGGLLLVMQKLCDLVEGVGLDPQSQALM
jgi:hypothetical protein